MSKVPIWDKSGATVGDVEVADSILTLRKGEQAVHDVVVALMAGRRAGTASTLEKSDVSGSRAKPWRQKGLGRARAGYQMSPVWRGGGIAFGPHPRSYERKVPRKVRDLAFRRALSERIANGGVRVVEALSVPAPRTREFAALLKAFGVTGAALCALGDVSDDIRRASRNLARVAVVRARDVNVVHLLRYPLVIADRPGWSVLEKRLAGAGGARP